LTFGAARAAFVATLGVAVVVFIYGLRTTWAEASSVGARPDYFLASRHYHLSRREADALSNIGLSPAWHAGFVVGRYAVLFTSACVIAALLWFRSRSWAALYVAWFLVGSQFIFSSQRAIKNAPAFVEFGSGVLDAVGVLSVFALLLTFPDDRFAPGVFAVAATLLATGTVIWLADHDSSETLYVSGAVLVVFVILPAGLVLQVVRAVRIRTRERWQLLALTAGGVLLLVALLSNSESLSGIDQPGTGLLSLARRLAFETTVMVLPLLFGVGVVYLIMRRGLWQLDLSLNRALVYSTLTALLVAVYFLVVIVVQAMVNDAARIKQSTLAVVVSTGLIAVLALPAREWIQRIIDRLFFRQRYDLERTVESFEARLQDRDRLELVGSDLLAAASDAFEPKHVSLWVPRVRR
jgi:hypothetical protein